MTFSANYFEAKWLHVTYGAIKLNIFIDFSIIFIVTLLILLSRHDIMRANEKGGLPVNKKETYLELRDKMVVKANDLIQKSRFNMTLQQQKMLLFLISQVSPYDEEFKEYEFSLFSHTNQ